MKRRTYVLILLTVLTAVTGLLEHTVGSNANLNDWQNRGIYFDHMRSIWLPLCIALAGILITVIATGFYKDDNDVTVSD